MKEIPLSQGMVALVDDQDYPAVSKHKWTVHINRKSTYAVRGWNSNRISLHKFIMNPGAGFQVDHINHNGLDNRRSNLRVCSKHQNLFNKKKYSTNKTGFKGVSFLNGRFRAQIYKDRKNYHLGMFDTAEEAAKFYDEKAKLMFGEFAYLNFPKA